MKKILLSLLILIVTAFVAACSSDEDTTKVKLGVSGTDTRYWDFVAEKAAKEGIEIEIVSFNDYVQPNTALAERELDLNAFQTVAYFEKFIEEHDLDLVPIATTVLAPMGLYSEKYDDVKDIPENSTIAIPNDVSNGGRALLLLDEAGLIKVRDGYDGNLTTIENDIVENPLNLTIEPMVAAQTPRVLPDVAASIINNGIATDAGFNPVQDSIFIESETAINYLNIIAVRAEDKDDPTLNRIAELYQEEDVAEFIEKEYNGALIPTFVPLENIGW